MKMSKKIKAIALSALVVAFIGTVAAVSLTDNPVYDFLMQNSSANGKVTVLSGSTGEGGHRLLISGSSHERIAVVDYDGSTLWEVKGYGTLWTEVNDAEIAPNGDIVYAARNGFAPSGSFVRRITPDYTTGQYTLVWEYQVPSGGENHTCQILSSGNVLICETYADHIRMLELDDKGNIDHLIGDNGSPKEGFDTNVGSHNQLRQITKTNDGTYLLTHFKNDITYEINEQGETVATYPFGKGFTAVKDADGNVIITGGNQSAIKAFRPDGTALWSISKNDIVGITLGFPAAVIPLENGNILLANWGGHGGAAGASAVVEINPREKSLVWSMNTEDSGNISNIFVIPDDAVSDLPADQYRSPVDTVANSATNRVFTADYTNKTITAINAVTDAVVATYSVPDCPNALAVSSDGSRLYATCGEENGVLAMIDTGTGEVRGRLAMGYTPTAIAFGADESTLYVANRFDSSVARIALSADGFSGRIVTEETITREPMAISYAAGKVYVASHLPNVAATETVVASEVCVLDPDTLKINKTVMLPNGSTDLKDMAVSPDGKYIYATHTLGRYWVPTTQLDRGWVYNNAVTEIDTSTQEITATMLLDDLDLGAGNPWGVAVANEKLAVSIAGTGEVIIIDRDEMRNRLNRIKAGNYKSADGSVTKAENIQDSLTFLSDIKKRVTLDASGTKGIGLLNGKLYAANYYSGSISVVDLEKSKKIKDIQLASTLAESNERAGERLWNDATISYGMWLSCASCHPDARADGLNWDNMNDGIGTNKQARTMIDTFARGRVMSTGIRADADTAVKAGMRFIMFNNGITEEQFTQISDYLKSLEPAPSPKLNSDGTLTASAENGKALFEGKANCTACHSNEIFGKDAFVYHLYSNDADKEQRGLLVPPLREVWRTAPYLHDGSAATIENVFQTKIKSGNTALASLSETELTDLANYVRSIGAEQHSNVEITFVPGDVSGDGNVDLNDVVILAQYVAKWDGLEYVTAALDTTGDGEVNLNDIVHLAQYVAQWENVELSKIPYSLS